MSPRSHQDGPSGVAGYLVVTEPFVLLQTKGSVR